MFSEGVTTLKTDAVGLVSAVADIANSRIIYKDSSGEVVGLTAGTNLSVSEGALNASGGAGSADWGNIGGTLGDQIDLTNALAAKVAGPASVTTDRIAVFDGTTGKLIKQAAITASDVVQSDTTTSVDNEPVLFSGTGGKTIQSLTDAYSFLSGQVAAVLVPISQSDYDALTTGQKETSGIIYVVFDDEPTEPVSNFITLLGTGIQSTNTNSHTITDIDIGDMSTSDTILLLSGARGSTTYVVSSATPSATLTLGAVSNDETLTQGTGSDSSDRQVRTDFTTFPVSAVSGSDLLDLVVGFAGNQFQSISFALRLIGSYTIVGGDSAVASGTTVVLEPVPDTSFAAGDIRIDLVASSGSGATAISVPLELSEVTQNQTAGNSAELKTAFGVTSENIATSRSWTVGDVSGNANACGISVVLRPA